MTDILCLLINVRRPWSIFKRHRVDLVHPACAWLTLALLAVSLVGCGQRLPIPHRDELVLLLGEMDEDVVVLGGEVRERTSKSVDKVLLDPTPDKSTQGASATKLWLVRSANALLTPKANGQPLSSSDRASKPNIQVKVSKNAFPARVLYDIATSLQIKEADLPSPPAGTFTSDRGSLSDRTRCDWPVLGRIQSEGSSRTGFAV